MNKFKSQIILKCSVIFVGLLSSLLAYHYFKLMSWSAKPQKLSEEIIVEVPKGITLRKLAKRLEEKELINDSDYFIYWLKIQRNFRQFQAGTYQFKDAATPQNIINKMVKGDVYKPLVLQFTIPEGFTLDQVNERLEALGVSDLKSLEKLSKDREFIKALGLNVPSLEGFLYPATYRFYRIMPKSKEIYETLVKEFFKRLPANYLNEIKKFKINLYQAVIIASMIEKETLIDSEKPLISEVIWRRLNDGIPLGIDATLIYGIKDYKGNIRKKHLRDASNLYNSRIHAGLPPTPIGSPSRSALEAVVNPANEGNYYYVLLPGTDKKHHFSKTLKEHNKYVRKLVNALKADKANQH